MASLDSNSAIETVLPSLPDAKDEVASDSTPHQPNRSRDEIEPQALLLLREFFLLLDEWDRQGGQS